MTHTKCKLAESATPNQLLPNSTKSVSVGCLQPNMISQAKPCSSSTNWLNRRNRCNNNLGYAGTIWASRGRSARCLVRLLTAKHWRNWMTSFHWKTREIFKIWGLYWNWSRDSILIWIKSIRRCQNNSNRFGRRETGTKTKLDAWFQR